LSCGQVKKFCVLQWQVSNQIDGFSGASAKFPGSYGGIGIPAALLAANIQALVRSIASAESTPLALANRINKHLSRYTPAVFIVLSRDSGELSYVNAGHDAPIVFCSGSKTFLEATGPPLGLFIDAEYEARTAVISPGGTLLMFTDGLTDSIRGGRIPKIDCVMLSLRARNERWQISNH